CQFDCVCRLRRSQPDLRAVGCVRSQQLCTERADRCPRLATDQQSDCVSAESSADPDQPGEKFGDAAVLVVVATGTVDPAYPATTRPGPAYRLRHPADRSRILDDLCVSVVVQSLEPSVDRGRANALAECDGRHAG